MSSIEPAYAAGFDPDPSEAGDRGGGIVKLVVYSVVFEE